MQYKTPAEYMARIHHVRPRFKNDVESVLLFVSRHISQAGELSNEAFKDSLNSSIRLYPGNSQRAQKTIDNWRTEISALFGLIQYGDTTSRPSSMSKMLSDNEDLIEFFRSFLYNFQYPGAHLKPAQSAELIQLGVKFKPAKYLLEVLVKGQDISDNNSFGISKAEATHFILNDLRSTRDNRSAEQVVQDIKKAREAKRELDSSGDVVRYAGDVLDYMALADLLRLKVNGRYYLNTTQIDAIQVYIDDSRYFPGYENLYGLDEPEKILEGVKSEQASWFDYVNSATSNEVFKGDVLSLLTEAEEEANAQEDTFKADVFKKITEWMTTKGRVNTKDIGDVGESLVIEHEKNRLISLSREDLIHLVQKIPERFAVGYDINSHEGSLDKKRFIEVKTTISRNKLVASSFHMTPNEWTAANTNGDAYFIYRLLISGQNIELFLIQDPVRRYKEDLVDISLSDGADVKYSEHSGKWETLLV